MLEHRFPPVSAVDNKNQNNLFNYTANENIPSFRSSESISTSFRSEAVPSHDSTSMSAGLSGRRSRPSFLDAISVSRSEETDKPNPFSSKIHPVDPPVSSNSQSFMNLSIANERDPFVERRNDFNSTKQNEDFAALEQVA